MTMRSLLRIGLIALPLLAPIRAHAAVCTSRSSFVWAGIGTGDWTCGAGTAGDAYAIASGHVVSLGADVVQSATAGAGISVENGGTLLAQGALRLVLGPAGLVCQWGSTCTLEGAGFRELGAATPALQPALSEPIVGHVADLVPCPDTSGTSACGSGGDAQVLRLSFPGAPDPGIASIAPGDVLCFGDASPGDLASHPDDGACYEVQNDPGATSPQQIDLDVTQSPGSRDSAGYPFALRALASATVQDGAGVAAGARTVQLPPGTLGASHDLVGRWLRFADGSGAPEWSAYKISRTTDGGGGNDVIEIGDVRGFATAHAAGTTVWLDYGWSRGDPFFVWSPLRLESASAAETDSPISFSGQTTLRRALLDRLGSPSNGLGSTGVVRVRSPASVVAFEDVWIADPAGAPASIVLVLEAPTSFAARRVQQTGGTSQSSACAPYTAACEDYLHVVGMLGSVGSVRLEDLNVRHHGDDVVLFSYGNAADVVLRRVHAAFASRWAATADLVDLSSALVFLDARGLVCDDCTSRPIGGSSAGVVFNGFGNGSGRIADAAVWGARGHVACPEGMRCRNLSVVGLDGTSGAMFGGDTSHLVVRDATLTDAASTLASPGERATLRRALVRDARFGNQQGIAFPAASGKDLRLESSVFLDVNGPTTSFLLNGGVPMSPVVVKQVSAVWTKPHDADRFLNSYTTGHALLSIDRVLVQGLNGPGEIALAVDLETASKPGVSCFFGNAAHWPGTQAPFVPAAWIASNALGPTDPPRAASFPWTAGLDCGATGAVGITSPQWSQGVTLTAPEHLGDSNADLDGDGVPDLADVCPDDADPAQSDLDMDGDGDACDFRCGNGGPTRVTGVSPNQALAGSAVTVSGTGFGASPQVTIGGVLASVSWDGSTLIATVPALPAGSDQPVQVIDGAGCRGEWPATLRIGAPTAGCGLLGVEGSVASALLFALRRRSGRRVE